MKDIFDALENLMWLTQLGLSVLAPPVCFAWLCTWLVTEKGWPMWWYAVFIPLGLATGGASFWKFCKMVMKKMRPKPGEKTRINFNKHS